MTWRAAAQGLWISTIGVFLILAAATTSAETLLYTLEIPDGRSATYNLDLEVREPGPLSVRAEWKGPRTLSLKLDPPNNPWGVLRHSGPSPQILETAADSETGTWKLQVHVLAASGAATGTLTIELPPREGRAVEGQDVEPEPPPTPMPDPWMLARPIPAGLPADRLPFFYSAERFRAALVGDDSNHPTDVCRWQSPFMRYLSEWRNRVAEERSAPSLATASLLLRIASAIESVERMQSSRDPLLNGPGPADPTLRDTWLKLRSSKLDPLEGELDTVLALLQRDHAPELTDQSWPVRMISCLTACERYFEQRPRVGEERAGNRDLALAQWPRLLVAADALEALAALTPERRAAQ